MSDLFCLGAGRIGSAIKYCPSANTCPNGKRKLGSSHAALLIADLLRITFPGLTFHDFSTRYNANFRSGTRRLARRLVLRSEEHTSELQSLMRISYAVFCLKNK